MSRRPAPPPPPLPQRSGIDPVRLRLPADEPGGWPSARDYLVERLSRAGAATIDRMLAEGGFVTADGTPIGPDAPFTPGQHLWFHRDFPAEVPVPFPMPVLYRDEHILVVDKPHYLAMTPRGRHITETALARLRHEFDLPRLSPAHRLDRLTAGVALFVVQPGERAAYQGLFQRRQVRKEYRAVARHDDSVALPRTVRSRIHKEHGRLAACEVPGPPNAESRIELLDSLPGGLARYRLLPTTGRTHQLRVHMCRLGLPIVNDPIYPRVLEQPDPADFSHPLQLLAHRMEFTDPITGARHCFVSARTLGDVGAD